MTMRLFSPLSGYVCVCVAVFRTTICLAQLNTPVELTWDAPKECPQDAEVQQQLRQLVGKFSGEKAVSFQARGTIESLDGHYRLTLNIVRGATNGARVIDSDDCKSLAKAASIVLALLVQKEKTLGRDLSESEISGQPDEPRDATRQSSPVQAPAPAASAQPPIAESPQPQLTSPPVKASSPWHFLIRVPQAKIDFATLPRPGYGIGLGGGVSHQAWRAFITATYYPTQRLTSSGSDPYRMEFRRVSLDALGCYGWRSGEFEFAPCGTITADHVSAHAGGDYLISQDKGAFWLSIGAGFSGHLHLSRRLALVALTTGRIATNRAKFQVGAPVGTEQTHRVPLAILDIAFACEWIF
jgi:hypothetical protein